MIRTNIRQKIIAGLVLMCIANGGIAAISYSGLVRLQEKIFVVEFADDLSNTILEIRRSEKNFLLFYGEDNLQENQDFVNSARQMLAQAPVAITDRHVTNMLHTLQTLLDSYMRATKALPALRDKASEEHSAVDELRNLGKALIEQSKLLATYERRQIVKIANRVQTNIVSSVLFMIFLGIGLFYFVSAKILTPLKIIEQTTSHIAQGNFEPLPVWNTRDEIQRLMEAFNRMVRELETRQNQLVQAQKLSSIGTLASGIAHQLNNPLNNISTSCQIVMEEVDNLPSYSNKMLTNIEQETARARDIVRGLLEFSRNQEFQLQSTNLKNVVQRAIRLVSSQVPSSIVIDEDISDDTVLNLDIQRMSECLINLLINATQAIEGSGTISIYTLPPDTSECISIVIEDTGGGISQDDLNRIFDPFYTTKGATTGTGLGLYVVYGIIKQHNGDIHVESVPGVGTKFYISLPLDPTTKQCRRVES